MNKNDTDKRVAVDALVRELLGLDPRALATLSPAEDLVNGPIVAGLRTFMRRTLERSLSLVDCQDATLRLHTETTARAHGWPDRATADLHELCVWSLIREARRVHSRSFAPLRAADRKVVALPPAPDGRFASLSVSDLVAEAQRRLDFDMDLMRDAPHTSNPTSVRTLIRRRLRMRPERLMTPYYPSCDLAEAAYARDPEGQAASGLAALVLSALHSYQVMVVRRTSRIRLMTERDAEEGRRPNARAANWTTLLAAALHAEGDREVWFMPPRERTDEERELLHAAAKYAYKDGGDAAGEGLNWLADGDTHFGAYMGFPLGDRLLHSVAREIDPTLERMPLLVAAQEMRAISSEEEALDMLRHAAARRRGAA